MGNGFNLSISSLTGSTGWTGFFHDFHLPAIASRSGEAGGDETVNIKYPTNPVYPVYLEIF